MIIVLCTLVLIVHSKLNFVWYENVIKLNY